MPEPITTDTTLTPTGTPPAETPPAPPAAPPQGEPAQPAPRMFTQEQVNEIVAREKRQAREKAGSEARSHTPAAQAPPAATPPDALSLVQTLRDDIAFRDVIADSGLHLSARQREVLRTHYRTDSPESVVELAREIFPGVGKPPAGTPPANPAAAASPPAAAPGSAPAPAPAYQSPGAPSARVDAGIEADPMTWTKDQTTAYEKDGTLMPRIERWKATQPGGGGGGLFPSRTTKR